MNMNLYNASSIGDIAVVKQLIASGVDANTIYDVEGVKVSPLYIAAQNGHIEVVKLLQEAGAKIILDGNRLSPINIAAASEGEMNDLLFEDYWKIVEDLDKSYDSDFEVVVVAYNVDKEKLLSRLKREFPNEKVTIYNKGEGSFVNLNMPSTYKAINIENIGYFGGTILYHIIKNYFKLAQRILFIQDFPYDHAIEMPLLRNKWKTDSGCQNIYAKCSSPQSLAEENKRIKNVKFGKYSGEMNDTSIFDNADIEAFAKEFIGHDIPEKINMCSGAQFAVDKENILSRKIGFYKNILAQMGDRLSIIDHYLECLWDVIFKKGEVVPMNSLVDIISLLKKIGLPGERSIYSLPYDMVFVVNDNDKFLEVFNPQSGLGHEPHMIKKLLSFAREGETYVEIGANYGDFALQMSHQLGPNGKVYAFEPGLKVFECLDMSVSLNGLSNIIVTENLAILDQPQVVTFSETSEKGAGTLGSHVVSYNKSEAGSAVQATTIDLYFETLESSIDILRFDVEGSECSVLKGARKTIASSPNIRIFVEWQRPLLDKYESIESMRECLSSLEEDNFIFLDASHFVNSCDYSIFKLSSDDILKSKHLEILAVRENTIKEFTAITKDQAYCFSAMNYYLYLSALRGNIESIKNLLSLGADSNSISGIGGKSFGATPLHIAAQNGDVEVVKLLLAARVDLEKKASNDLTPLCIAAQNKHSDIVQLLIEKNANIDCELPSGANALYVSASLGDTETAIALLKVGASKDVMVDDLNILNRAQRSNNAETVRLFELGIDGFCEQAEDARFIELCGKEGFCENC